MSYNNIATLSYEIYLLVQTWRYEPIKEVLIEYEPVTGYYYFGLENHHGIIKVDKCHRNSLDTNHLVMIQCFRNAHYKFRKEYVEHGNGD